MNKTVRWICIILAAVIALYFMPFVTVEGSDGEGRTWRIPFASWFVSDDGSSLTFASIRSAYAAGKDSANAMHSYEEVTCRGKTYYYDADNDVSFSGYDTSSGIPSSVQYHYVTGNACQGWTDDDEVAWAIGDISEADLSISAEDAEEKGWFVIQDGIALNEAAYNDFSRMAKQGVCSILRTLVIDGDERKLIDVQLLENPVKVEQKNSEGESVEAEAFFKAVTRTADGAETNYYTNFSDTKSDGTYPVQVKGSIGSFDNLEETVLFEYSLQ
jgi:hypothetical protein